jgi:hypothetical protein
MVPASSRELLQLVIEDGSLTLDEIKEFAAKGPREDLFLDYKDGKLLDTLKDARATVRRWVSGFANAEGGVLVFGFDELRPRQLSPCVDRIGAEPLDSWARKVLAGMEGYFSPPPRFRCLPVESGREVLLIAVARAPQLVPCYEAGETKYFLRFHDSTPEVPPYLISDLVLGRRQHPIVNPELHEVTVTFELLPGADIAETASLSFRLSVENRSLVLARALEVGLVGWSWPLPHCIPLPDTRLIGAHLREHIDIPTTAGKAHLKYCRTKSLDLGPFDATFPMDVGPLRVPCYQIQNCDPMPLSVYRLSAALYLMPSGSPPSWFEIHVRVNTRWGLQRTSSLTLRPPDIDLEQITGRRPTVDWRPDPP